MPIAGVATWAVGAAGVVAAAATVWVVSALLAVLVCNACAVGAALDSVTVATVPTTCPAPMVVVGAVAFTVAECVEFDSVSAGVGGVCSACGAGVAGGVLASVGSVVSPEAAGSVTMPLVSSSGSALVDGGAVDAPDSVVLVCAPPLLLIVTPDPTSADEDVVPDVLLVAVESAPVVAVDDVAVSVGDVPADPVVDVSLDVSLDVEVAELAELDSEDVPVVSALATPGEVTTITPIPKAAANAPTRPMYPPTFAALRTALRDGVGLVCALDEVEANRGLTGG